MCELTLPKGKVNFSFFHDRGRFTTWSKVPTEIKLLSSHRNWMMIRYLPWSYFKRRGSHVLDKDSLGCKTGKRLLQRFYASKEQQTIYIFKFSDVSALKIERARTTVDKVHPDSVGGRMSGAWRQEEACLKFRLTEVNVKPPLDSDVILYRD